MATNKTLEGVKTNILEALQFHIEGMLADGDYVPDWLVNGDYEFEFYLESSALLRSCERYASIASIARASGINEWLLSHYTNGIKNPRPQQRQRIIDGIHKIGREFLSVV